jgi:GT2 family glycosyltransferase
MTVLRIIIVNWNTRGVLRACLDSIKDFPPPFPLETIVVDNASTDDSVDFLGKEYPGVCVIVNRENRGFAAACNQGARSAAAPWLLFLNPDTLVHSGTLAGAVSFMEQHPEAGVMGCRTVNCDGSLQATAFAFPGKLRIFAYVSGLNRVLKLSRFTDHSALRTPDYVQGSFLLVRREAFAACGGFDETFFLYAEEIDLCLRVKAAGFHIYYFPDIFITHLGGGSMSGPEAGLGHFINSSIGLYRKYRSAREEKKLRWALSIALRLRLVWVFLFSPSGYLAIKKALAPLFNTLSNAPERE